MRNQAQALLKLSCMLEKLVNTQIKGITLICTGKIIFVSVVFLMALSIFTGSVIMLCIKVDKPHYELMPITCIY